MSRPKIAQPVRKSFLARRVKKMPGSFSTIKRMGNIFFKGRLVRAFPFWQAAYFQYRHGIIRLNRHL
jgi:hypothetical protein